MASPVAATNWLAWVASLVESTPGRMCASAYPSDRFFCLLDELPLHLIPRRALLCLHSDPKSKEEYSFNPLCQILRDGELPPELESYRDLTKDFALQGTIAWVHRPNVKTCDPFWLGPRLADVVDGLASGQPAPSLSDADANLLIAARILIAAEESEQGRIPCAAECAAGFEQRDYVAVPNLLHPFHVAALRLYYRRMIRLGRIRLGDHQSPRRYVAHNESVASFFHHQLTGTVSAIVGETVKPSYVYLASYLGGAELKKHTDREQCEFSVTICLDFSPEPAHHTSWPIRLDTHTGSAAVYQGLGDGLVYRGTRVPHYRHPLPEGQTSTSIFFHYVPLNFTGILV